MRAQREHREILRGMWIQERGMTMAQKHSESRIITAVVIAAVLVIVLNIVSFAVPLQKQSEEVFYTAYVMSEFVILAEMGIVIAQLAIDAPEHRVLGLPIVWSGFLGAIIQTVATICFYVVNAFYSLPVWVVAVIEALLIGYFIIQITLGFLYKNHAIESSDDKPNTAFMDEIKSRLAAIASNNRNENVQKDIENAYDVARGSDPVSSSKTAATENQILQDLSDLENAEAKGDEASIKTICQALVGHLQERRAYCKDSK